MNERRKSDGPIVPTKPPNEAGKPGEEAVEGRGPAKGNPSPQNGVQTQSWESPHSARERIRQAAAEDGKLRFTALMHHIYDETALREGFDGLRKTAAPGVDGVTWKRYEEGLLSKLKDLSARLKRGAYQARPVRRAYIPKADGRKRPLGVPTLEDKLVQRVAADVLCAVYEPDFLGFSYGFRPARGAHEALDALSVGLTRKRVNWVLDADIRGFFDAIDHGWLVKFLEHRIADKRVVRLIQKWLNAGVMEEGKRTYPEQGTPQGGSISPLLANVYLHYVFDLWAQQWRTRHARGEVILVRYADDFVVGFEHKTDAERFLAELTERFRRFGLELHADKTRLIEFGRYAVQNGKAQGAGKPETFNFLGFTHICGKSRHGWFQVRRHTMRTRMRAKLAELKAELLRRRHEDVPQQGRWLGAVVKGYLGYFAVPLNLRSLRQFRDQVIWHWGRALNRRDQKGYLSPLAVYELARRYLPPVRVLHPHPQQRFTRRRQRVMTRGGSPVR